MKDSDHQIINNMYLRLAYILLQETSIIAYAVWSRIGIVLISAIAWLNYGKKLDVPAIVSLGVIVAGVVVVNVFSKLLSH